MLTETYQAREKQITPEVMGGMERFVYLRTIDRLWIDHLDAIDDLREGIGLRGYAQQDPLVEYKKEAFASFERLMGLIDHEVVRRIFRVQFTRHDMRSVSGGVARQPIIRPQQIRTNIDQQDRIGLTPPSIPGASLSTQPSTQPTVQPVRRTKKLGRNDPCWCGKLGANGRPVKWKKCHYPEPPPR